MYYKLANKGMSRFSWYNLYIDNESCQEKEQRICIGVNPVYLLVPAKTDPNIYTMNYDEPLQSGSTKNRHTCNQNSESRKNVSIIY